MREISVGKIGNVVKELCLKANFELRKDILSALRSALKIETSPRARGILKSIIENARLAKSKKIAICQDTGFVIVFLEIGQDVALTGGNLEDAVNDGVKEAYAKGCLRRSVVDDPILRRNTNTNTPAILHVDIVEGEKMKVIVSLKGFGSENKSKIKMFNPTAHIADIKKFIVDAAIEAGPSACPPFAIGVGIGGTLDKAVLLSRKALLRPIGKSHTKKHFRHLEKEILKEINLTGMGPMGLGGKTTALGVSILDYPTHIAGLPVAVNVSCHATRNAEAVI